MSKTTHVSVSSNTVELSEASAQILEDYVEEAELQNLTARTVTNYRSSIRIFLEHLGEADPREVGNPELRSFLKYLRDERQISASAIGLYFSALNSFYQYLEYEEEIKKNPIPAFRKRYLKTDQRDTSKDTTARRQLISVEQLRTLVHSVPDIRDRAVIVLLAKTGVRRNELIQMDVEDINWTDLSITLKRARKRTNHLVYFDDETARILHRWVNIRRSRGGGPTGPLFINERSTRLNRNGIYNAVTQAAEKLGLHNPKGRLEEKFTPHCLRHWFTTHLRRSGMPREHIAELRGDAHTETIDIYLHIDRDELRESYRAHIPQLGL